MHESIDKLLRDHVIICRLVSSDSLLDELLDVFEVTVNDDICSFRVKISKRNNTMYRFLISLNKSYDSNNYIIPIISEIININDTIYNKVDEGYNKLLYCHRAFDINTDRPLIIKEEYGNTLGSHVYDCSIILFYYILNNFSQFLNKSNTTNTGIELGCGCGLLGILLAKLNICSHVYLTDQSNQLPLIQENIKINQLESAVGYELDWDNHEQIQKFINDTGQPDFIIASDVLYSETMAISLFNTIRKLASTKTKIFIAQKIRKSHDINGVNITLFPNFTFNKVLVESNVIVWEIFHC